MKYYYNSPLLYERGFSAAVNSNAAYTTHASCYNFDYDCRTHSVNMKFPHFHSFYEVMILLSPKAYHFVEGKRYDIIANDLILLAPSILHQSEYLEGSPSDRIIIGFTPPDKSHPYASESLAAACAFLSDMLERHRSESVCEVYSIGHTHIDVAWKWPLRQTREKAARSFQTVLSLMKAYPEYLFMSNQPQLYQFVKEDRPELYAQIKERVQEGRWETEGAMWLEADCNLSSGESLIRHILHGKRFFREEFGCEDNVVLWLPDVFGYSAALPQIMQKTGLRYFMTTKIGWNDTNKFPYDTLYWEGIDGSRVLSHFITTCNYRQYPELCRGRYSSTTYNGLENASQVMGTWQRYQNKPVSRKVLTCYGYGDGGGTTPEMIKQGKRLEKGLLNLPRVRFSKVRDFFENLEQEVAGKDVPLWCGELYLEFHRGTYTSMAAVKQKNRQREFLLLNTEALAALALSQNAGGSAPRSGCRLEAVAAQPIPRHSARQLHRGDVYTGSGGLCPA